MILNSLLRKIPKRWPSKLLPILLVACDTPQPNSSQVLVRVNNDDISIHQLNFAIEKSPWKITRDEDRKALLEKMINRQLAAQQALEKQLDRSPDVMMRLEEARLDILAAAYAEHISQNTSSTHIDGAAAYYAEHPFLFAERKFYRLREIAIPMDSPAVNEIRIRLEHHEDIDSMMAWLRKQMATYTDTISVKPAEQLPLQAVKQLASATAGQILSVPLPRALIIYQLQSTETVPLDWVSAKPMIETYLKKTQSTANYQSELQRLRTMGEIVSNSVESSPPYAIHVSP